MRLRSVLPVHPPTALEIFLLLRFAFARMIVNDLWAGCGCRTLYDRWFFRRRQDTQKSADSGGPHGTGGFHWVRCMGRLSQEIESRLMRPIVATVVHDLRDN